MLTREQTQVPPPDAPLDFMGVLRHELAALRAGELKRSPDPIADAHAADLSGLALSGGGIRSATFNLGILQALASLGILKKFDYLSTVSGGGYIGCWLAAWLRRHIEQQGPEQCQQSFEEVMADLGLSAGSSDDCTDAGTRRNEPSPIAHLREFSNYLTPRKGLWGTDTWTLAVAYLRNFLLTVSVLIGALMAVIFWVRGAVVLNGLMLGGTATILNHAIYWLFITTMTLTAFAASTDLQRCRTSAGDKQCSKFAARLSVSLTTIAVWLGACVLWQQRNNFMAEGKVGDTLWAFAIALGIVFCGGVLGVAFAPGKTEDESQSSQEADRNRTDSLWSRCKRGMAALGGAIVFFIAIWGLCLWFKSSAGAVTWLASDYWVALLTGPPLMLGAFTLFAIVFTGLAGRDLEELEREWLARTFAAITKWTFLFCLLTVAVIGAPIGLRYLQGQLHGILGALWAVISTAGAWLGRAGKKSEEAGFGQTIRKAVMAAAPVVFIAGLLIILIGALDSAAINRLFGYQLHVQSVQTPWQIMPNVSGTALGICLGVGLACFLITLAWSWRVGVNTFSLHALYGNRLIRAYLGASNSGRRHHPFTGFDLDDNKVRMADLVPNQRDYRGPYLLVNAAINLVHATRLAWQQRKAGAFLFSPLYCGYEFPREGGQGGPPKETLGGYAPSRFYADGRHSNKGISLGKTMTISGAAASPNMGYRSSLALAFLMTVFNVRLGWWLPNTAFHDHRLWRKPGPSLGLLFLARELLGLTDAGNNFAYVSDGGHFENLGVYELVRRRCRYIVACDAEEDAGMNFGGLGIAIERCRTDFGIPIDIDVSQLRHDPQTGLSRWHCAVGRIRYSLTDAGQPDGTLLYLKASLIGDEPQDIATYAAANPSFPHQSTADQWFDEMQFESYRALGHHIATSVLSMPAQVVRRNLAARALVPQATAEDLFLKELFVEVGNQWYPHADSHDRDRGDHDILLEELLDTMRNDSRLAFLDWQLYPDLGRISRNARLDHRTVPWVPDSYEELRAGFFFCRRLIQFMQQIFHDLRLDIHYDAPSHRGWMSLLQRWSLSRMVRYTWSMSAGCYSTRFQTFCAHHLRLEVSELSWSEPLEVHVERKGTAYLLQPAARQISRQPIQNVLDDPWRRAERAFGLDFFETQLLCEYLRLYCASREKSGHSIPDCFHVFPLRISTEDPTQIRRDAFATITVGFAIVQPQRNLPEEKATLLYLRIRPAMRRMGLARKAMREMAAGKPLLPIQVTQEKIEKMVSTEEHWHRRIYLELYPEQEQQFTDTRRRLAQMINREIAKLATLNGTARPGERSDAARPGGDDFIDRH